MSVLSWAVKAFRLMTGGPKQLAVGIVRGALRGIVSIAIKLEEKLPDIKETMGKIDPGKEYGEWVQQYRQTVHGSALEEKLALWDPNQRLDASVITAGPFRRARQYRYIFSAAVRDEALGTTEWKMFSMYSNQLMSPNEIKNAFQSEYFTSMYENNIVIEDIAMKRVWKRVPFKTK